MNSLLKSTQFKVGYAVGFFGVAGYIAVKVAKAISD